MYILDHEISRLSVSTGEYTAGVVIGQLYGGTKRVSLSSKDKNYHPEDVPFPHSIFNYFDLCRFTQLIALRCIFSRSVRLLTIIRFPSPPGLGLVLSYSSLRPALINLKSEIVVKLAPIEHFA
jgi:hypothetical protein